MRLVKGWQTWWRQWSTWLLALSLMIFNINTVESLLYAWQVIPDDLKLFIPDHYRQAAGTAIGVIAAVSRYIRQQSLYRETYGENAPL